MRKPNLKNLKSAETKVKYTCAKEAIAMSKANAFGLYPDYDIFLELLNSDNKIMRWTAIQVLGNLSAFDAKQKIDKLVPRFIILLHGRDMITASNAVLALTEIAKNKPRFKKRILDEFLKVAKDNYYISGQKSTECRNIAIGHVIKALEQFPDDIQNKEYMEFIKRQTKNSRPATAKKAMRLLKKVEA